MLDPFRITEMAYIIITESWLLIHSTLQIEAIKQDADLAVVASKFTRALRGVEMKEILKVSSAITVLVNKEIKVSIV